MAGGALKLLTISSLSHHSHKFPIAAKLNPQTLIAAASSAFRPPGWWRCCMISRPKIPQATTIGFAVAPPKSPHFSSIPRKRQGLYSSRGLATAAAADHMGPAPSDHDDHHGKKPLPPPPHSEKLLTLPTILTLGRVAAVPLLVATFYVESWWGPNVTTGIFIAAAITDWLDGYLARKMKQGTAFGAFLDPVADKLMVAATLVLLCTKPLEAGLFGQSPWLLTVPAIAIIGREITMSAVREWAASQDGKLSEAVAVNNLGKWKTATQMIALTILLAARDSSLATSETLVASAAALLYISAWLSLWSLAVYMRKIWKVLLM